jgi:hypothetical protein
MHISGNVLGEETEEVALNLNTNKEHFFFTP